MTKKIIIRAPLLSRSGYGEHARMVVDALSQHPDKFDLYVENVGWGQMPWITDFSHKRKYYDMIIAKKHSYNGPFDLGIHVSIPPEFTVMAPKNIGFTAGIESNLVPPAWLAKCSEMDLLVVTSQHAATGFKGTVHVQHPETGEKVAVTYGKPIQIINYPIKNLQAEDMSAKIDLDTDFNFLSIAQWGPRKNVDNMLKWFVEEFQNDEVGLVLKTSRVKNNLADRQMCSAMIKSLAEKFPNKKCKIHLLHGTMSDEEIHGLYKHPKIRAYVTTTHGEGYGLPLFEAAYSEMPVIATGWSGHLDFLCIEKKTPKGKVKREALYEKISYSLEPIQKEAEWPGVLDPGTKWAYAKENSFKKAIRKVYQNISLFERRAKTLSDSLRSTHTEQQIQDQVVHTVLSVIGDSKEQSDWQDKIETVETL